MPTAEVNGQSIYYEMQGEGEPLLCVHGLAVNTLGWLLQLQEFSQRHQTVIFDNRDVGQSSMVEGEYEVADMAADALALADELELDGFHLLGISMGGAIAQEIALAAPERVRTLTLTVTFVNGGAWGRKLGEVWSSRRQKLTYEEHIDELVLLNLSEAFFENAEAVEYIRGMMLADPHPQPPEAFGRQIRASSRHDTRDRIGSLPMPVHVIGAEFDILVPVWKSRELHDLIPGSKLTVMDGAPHGVSLERPAEFNPLVLGFIAEQAAVAG
jgi:pimeloyl-ACP methyl ester carboxylesterase